MDTISNIWYNISIRSIVRLRLTLSSVKKGLVHPPVLLIKKKPLGYKGNPNDFLYKCY